MDQSLKTIFVRNIIFDALTIPIPALLIVQALHRKNRTPEIVLFFRMCVFDILLCISYILACLLLINYQKIPIAYIFDFILNFLIGLFPLLLVVHWLLFVEYTLHHSRDIIWRRYRVAMIPFAVGVVCTILCITIYACQPKKRLDCSYYKIWNIKATAPISFCYTRRCRVINKRQK